MSRAYIQVSMFFDDCRNGLLKVLIANSTTDAATYDPTSGLPVYAGGVPINVDGYAEPFTVDVDSVYDLYAYNSLGALIDTRPNVVVLGGQTGLPGPQGPIGPAGATGAKGAPGANGADGIDGTNGQDGSDGISLVSIRVNELSGTGQVLYTLSDDPGIEREAGSVMPGGLGQIKTTATDSLDFAAEKFVAGAGASVGLNAQSKIEIANTAPETFKTQVNLYSTTQAFLSNLFVVGPGIDISMTPDFNQLKIQATGEAVGGFLWKGEWEAEVSYNVNNSVWYFDETVIPAINRLYIATAPNQGVNPYEDNTGSAWSTMIIIDTLGDQFVKVNATDSIPGYLFDKLVEGENITLEVVDNLGVKTLKVHAAAADAKYPVYYEESVVKGQPLYVTDNTTASLMYVSRARTDGDMPAMLIADNAYSSGQVGTAITSGLLSGIDLTGMPNGTTLYVATSGGYTTTQPYEKAQIVGLVARGGVTDGSVMFSVDSSYVDKVTNTGVIGSAPSWTSVGNVVTMSSCRIRLYNNMYYRGYPTAYTVPSSSVTIPNNSDSLIVATYNNGSPIYIVSDAWNFSQYNASNAIPVAKATYDNGILSILSLGETGNGSTEKIFLRNGQTNYYGRAGNVGLMLSSNSSRSVDITAASVWANFSIVDVVDFSSESHTLTQFVKTSGIWSRSVISAWNNTQINDDAGLVTMGNAKYSVVWVYRRIATQTEAFVVQHPIEFSTFSDASAAGPRSDLPPIIQSHCMLVGRFVFQKSASTWATESAFNVAFGASTVTLHNNLGGLDVGDYRHLTDAQKTSVLAIVGDYLSKTTATAQTVASAVTINNVLSLVSGSIPLVVKRSTAATTGVVRCATLQAISSGDAANTFGSAQRVVIQDTSGVENELGLWGIVRNGADNTGRFVIQLMRAGVPYEVMSLDDVGSLDVVSLKQGGVTVDSKFFNKLTGDTVTGQAVVNHGSTPLVLNRSDTSAGASTIIRLAHITSQSIVDGTGVILEAYLKSGATEFSMGEIRCERFNGTNNESIWYVRPRSGGNQRNTFAIGPDFTNTDGTHYCNTPPAASAGREAANAEWIVDRTYSEEITHTITGVGQSITLVSGAVHKVSNAGQYTFSIVYSGLNLGQSALVCCINGGTYCTVTGVFGTTESHLFGGGAPSGKRFMRCSNGCSVE